MVKYPLRKPTSLKIALASGVLGMTVFIGGGAWYVEQNPAFSFRAIYAELQRPLYALRYAPIVEAAPVSEEQAVAIPALTYHRVVSDSTDIANITRSRFVDQMTSLKKAGWNTVTLEEFERFLRGEITLPEKSFLLTFDDGSKDSYYPVDPILSALGYEAVNFIIVEPSRIPNTTYYLNPREIRRMLESGRWDIGSHSRDGHRPYSTDSTGGTGIFFADLLWNQEAGRLETPEEFRARVGSDLAHAKAELEADYGRIMNSFAFPLGNETGINGANNFPEGSSITETEADTVYEFGHLQLGNQHYTGNFPRTLLTSAQSPAEPFAVRRVHVDYDWDGARILEILENSLPKEIPFEDDFETNHGWIPAWGTIEVGRNNFLLDAPDGSTGASTFLDGTALWDNYSFDAAVNWQQGHAIVLADVVNSSTYHSCAFSPGLVRINESIDGHTRTLAELRDPRIQYGEMRIGVRVHGPLIECSWNFAKLLESNERTFTGGIGLQTWNESQGTAELRVTSVIARPYGE